MIEAASKSKFIYDQSTLILLRVNIGVIDRTIIITVKIKSEQKCLPNFQIKSHIYF